MTVDYFAPVAKPDEHVEMLARDRQGQLTKPAGSLGRLEELGIWISACQGQCPPKDLADCRVFVFAGDHGIANHGVSAFPPAVSLQMHDNICAGGAGINAISAISGATVQSVDISLDHEAEGEYRVRRSCGSIDREDAMSEEEFDHALRVGISIANKAVDEGADLLMAGDLGIGNTTPAAALIGVVTGSEPVVVVGRGTGIDDNGWKLKVSAVRDAMFRVRGNVHEPLEVLRAISSPDLTAMAAFLAQAAIRRTPVILDGVVVTSAALLAEKMAPGAKDWWVAGHKSAEPAHGIALDYLGKKPIVEYGMRLGEGTGAATALPMVKMGVSILREMATFADAGVSNKGA